LPFSSAIAVSRDHKPDQTDERQRIEDAGGFVMWAGKDFTQPFVLTTY
jgi:serine/threonine protein phosphatase PrpC